MVWRGRGKPQALLGCPRGHLDVFRAVGLPAPWALKGSGSSQQRGPRMFRSGSNKWGGAGTPWCLFPLGPLELAQALGRPSGAPTPQWAGAIRACFLACNKGAVQVAGRRAGLTAPETPLQPGGCGGVLPRTPWCLGVEGGIL